MNQFLKEAASAAHDTAKTASAHVQAAKDSTGFFASLQNISTTDLLIAIGIVVGSLIVGIIFEAVVIRGLRRIARNTKWEWDDVLINSFRRAFALWFAIGGLYVAMRITFALDPIVRSTIQKIIVALLILSVTIIVARAAAGFVSLYSKKTQGGIPSTSLFSNLASLVIIIAGIVIILQNLGVSITPLITALGIGGLAVALALQDTLSNLFAGFSIIVSKQVRQGDFIQLESGEEGYVTDVKWRNTAIKSLWDTKVFLVPNSKIASSIVTNYSMPNEQMWITVDVGVHYDSDLQHVEKVAKEVADQVIASFYIKDFPLKPNIRFRTFGDSSINFSARLPVKRFMDQYRVTSEFIKRLHKRFNEEKIEIPYPIRNIYFRTGLKKEE
jgi:small-conductance mechanosensitive channel